MNARLFCKTGVLAGSKYRIGEKATIGREAQNDITLTPEAISGRHARIFFDDEEDCYVLEDLDSSNGTQIDDTEVIEPVPLRNLHVITFAEKVDFIFLTVDEEEPSSSEEGVAKTQFGMAPSSPSGLLEEDESDVDCTRYGETPGSLPDLPGEGFSSEKEEESSEESAPEVDRTQYGEAPGALPDLPGEGGSSEEEEKQPSEGGESDVEHTQFGEAPGALPDLPGEGDSSGNEEVSSSDEGEGSDADPSSEHSDGTEEGEAQVKRTQFGEAPGAFPDLPGEEFTSEETTEDTSTDDDSDVDRTQFGEAPGALPDLSTGDSSSEEGEEASEETSTPSEVSAQYALVMTPIQGSRDTYPLPEGTITIGRSEDCDIQVEDPGVSREHAQFIVESDKVILEDKGSKNFTFVNEERLTEPTALSPGTEIQFGLQVKAVLRRTSS